MGNIDIYDSELAGKYSREREKFLNADKEIFEVLESIGPANKVVIDVGCGDGRHARKIYELGAKRVIGVDNSEAMVALANQNATEEISFSYGEAANTHQESAVADIVFSNFVIHYVEDLQPVFSEFNRILRDGGKVVMTFNIFETENSNLHNTEVPLRLADVVVVTNLVKTHDEIKDALKSQGFSIDRYTDMDSSYLSIDESYEHKDDVSSIRNIICVASKR